MSFKNSIAEEVEKIIELAKKNGLKEFSLETDEIKISFKLCDEDKVNSLILTAKTEETKNEESIEKNEASQNYIVKSPLVGVFYRSPSPKAPPFVEVGDVVEVGQTLCIVEAMKVMNEVTSDKKGKVVKIFPKNGEMVEFDSPLFEIEVVSDEN